MPGAGVIGFHPVATMTEAHRDMRDRALGNVVSDFSRPDDLNEGQLVRSLGLALEECVVDESAKLNRLKPRTAFVRPAIESPRCSFKRYAVHMQTHEKRAKTIRVPYENHTLTIPSGGSFNIPSGHNYRESRDRC